MPAHGARVAQAEVHVVNAVHVQEMRACRALDIDGPGTGPFGHPEHRDAVRQMRRGLVEERLRPRSRGTEGPDLYAPELGETFTILVAHDSTDALASRRRLVSPATCVETTMMIASRNTAEAMTFACGGMPRVAAV